MNEHETIIDFGTKNIRLSIFNNLSENIFSSDIENLEILESKNSEKSLSTLIRSAEKYLSKHIDYVNILYDSSKFSFINLSIKKSFDQPVSIKKHYDALIEEANFIIKENYFKDQVIHLIISSIIIDDNKKLDFINEQTKIKSLILEIKFICLSKSIIETISNIFKKNNLNISNIYCSSYVKSFFYKKKFENIKNFIFLDIGFERTSAWFFYNNKFEFFCSTSLGGNNITKDISKVLKLSFDYSEDIKIEFNKYEKELNFNKKSSKHRNPYSEIFEKKISIDLLKEIIEARIDEIIEFTAIPNNYLKKLNPLEKPKLIFIGGGSRLLSNIYNLNSKKVFSDLIFFKEKDSMICEAGFNYNQSHESYLARSKNKPKKVGFFEKFFNLFSK